LVFIDVPCSNSGVFRRRPDAMWRWSPAESRKLTKLQGEILSAGSKLLAPNGQLIYSTCSIDPIENQQVVQNFIDHTPEFTLIEDKTLLPGQVNDGAYAAKLTYR